MLFRSSDMSISFAYKLTSTSYALILGVMTVPTDTSTFVAIDTFFVSSTTNFSEVELYNLNGYTGTGKYIAFMSKSLVASSLLNTVYVDDIVIELTPSCYKPHSLRIESISNDSCEISWQTRGSESTWEVVLGDADTDPDDETPVVVTSASCVFNGLLTKTSYVAYVRALCGDEATGWERIDFRTTGLAESLPLITGFEDATDNAKWNLVNGALLNKWMIGNGISKDGDNALYISNGTGHA